VTPTGRDRQSTDNNRSGSAWPAGEKLEGPLTGVKVLDLSRVLAGPWATMVLADMGADVIKIEPPEGDPTRSWGPPFVGETAVYYFSANRNKRSVVLDLTQAEDCEVARALSAEADVLVQNFRPGRAARFGLSYEDIRTVNLGCIYCSVTGYGSGTSQQDQPAYDLVVQAVGGMMGVTGIEDQPPVKVGVATADLLTGLYASTAILGVLAERARTGKGRQIEVPLIDTQIAGLANQALNWLAAGLNPVRLGSDHPNVAPYGAFVTGTGDIVIAIGNDRQFASLAEVVNHPEWVDDARFAHNSSRVANRALLRAELEATLRMRSSTDWLSDMRHRDIPCGPVRDVAEVFEDQELYERMVVHVQDSSGRTVPQVRSPFRFDGRPSGNMTAPPTLGQDTDNVVGHVKRTLNGDGRAYRGERSS
jgi:crotonobetainyl-CoA:carnitine CoA-transferase CaiB-like acyl-CoA transferase